MKVSIAMAVFNGAPYLQDQLDSIAIQSRSPDELVVSDDGSVDGSIQIIERFAAKAQFPTILLKNELTLGYTKNFDRAISACSGDVIFISDQDDFWFPNKIERILEEFASNPSVSVIIHDGMLVNSELMWEGATKLGQIRAGIGAKTNTFVTGALTVVRSEFVSYAVPIPEGIVGHDIWIHRLAALLGKRRILDVPLQLLRRHSTNTSSAIASSVRPLDVKKVVRDALLTPSADSYSSEANLIHCLSERVKILGSSSKYRIQSEKIESVLAALINEKAAIDIRNEMLTCRPVKRKLYAISLLFNGGYRYFNGFSSFIRDILR